MPSFQGGGPGGPLGLVECFLLRQMLRFSFETEEKKRNNVLQVYRLLTSLLGRYKSKGPLGGAKNPQRGPREAPHGGAPAAPEEPAEVESLRGEEEGVEYSESKEPKKDNGARL